MARFVLNPALPLPDYEDLSLGTENRTKHEIEDRLTIRDEYEELRNRRKKSSAALRRVIEHSLDAGKPDEDEIAQLRDADQKYYGLVDTYLQKEEFADLTAPVSRKDFDVSPPECLEDGKINLGNPFPLWSSAMSMLYPGTDTEHTAFLQKHRAHMHFPERLASLGGVFVSNPNATLQEKIALHKHMSTAHPYWRTAPRIFPSSSVGEVCKLLAHYEDDWPAVIENDRGEMIGVADRKTIEGVSEDVKMEDLDTSTFLHTEDEDMTPNDAYEYMEQKGADHLVLLSQDHVPRVMTKTTAALSELLPPFEYGDGLGAVYYFGVSDPDRTLHEMNIMDKQGVIGAIIETANANRQDVFKLFQQARDQHPDLFLAGGTADNPKAVREAARILDAWKVPIAQGDHCHTAHSGVRIPAAYTAMVNGAAAAGNISILVDGLGGRKKFANKADWELRKDELDDTSEFTIGMSFHNVIGRQGGGALLTRRESANPFLEIGGIRGKMGQGEASADARKKKGITAREDQVLVYSEGASGKFNEMRKPDTLGAFFLLLKRRLQSAMSYGLGKPNHNLDEGEQLRDFQQRVKLFHRGRR